MAAVACAGVNFAFAIRSITTTKPSTPANTCAAWKPVVM